MPTRVWPLLLAIWLTACQAGGAAPTRAAPPANPVGRVLMLTNTAGFRHDSIATAQAVVPNVAAKDGALAVSVTEDLGQISAASLRSYRVVLFALTSGELALSAEQKQALLDFVRGGGGFVGIHSATDTLYRWPEYGELVGAVFQQHGPPTTATVVVEDRQHPATRHLPDSYRYFEEYYQFRQNPRPQAHILTHLDLASAGLDGDRPLSWCKPYGAGRVYYNALGHFAATWDDPAFQAQVLQGLRWAAGLAAGACPLPALSQRLSLVSLPRL